MAEENQNMEETITPTQACSKGKCCCSKLLCLKGLSTIWKVLSILALILTLVMMFFVWRDASQAGYGFLEKLFAALVYGINGAIIALLFITISRILKTLRKIKHAVEHK